MKLKLEGLFFINIHQMAVAMAKSQLFMIYNFAFIPAEKFFTLKLHKIHFVFFSAIIRNIVRGSSHQSKMNIP